ncbi:MAG: Ig-like domain-containing protein [Marinovum sp.]|nr:Ig-like domain-containing protein [Marinovum sp.]
MNSISYVVRTSAGDLSRDVVLGESGATRLQMESGSQVSFNIQEGDVAGYRRVGGDLEITLADGRVVVLENYFADLSEEPRLYLSSDGTLYEVFFAEGEAGTLYAEYGKSAEWGKWSPDDQLIHYERAEVLLAGNTYDDGGGVSMLAAGLLGGSGLFGVGAAGAAAAGAAVIAGGGNGGGNGGGSGGSGPAAPTVDDTAVVVGGDDADQTFTVTGTGAPGDTVSVTVGGSVVETTIGADGTWSTTFTGTDFPTDGVYDAAVVVTTATGAVTLAGPNVTIDLTPPEIEATDGVVETGDILNLAGHSAGLTVNGTGEAGTTVTVSIDGTSHDAVVEADGSWSVTFGTGEIAPGEYTTNVVITSQDSYGNSTSITRTLEVDTVSSVTVDTSAAGGTDGVVNAVEQAGSVTLTGTADADSSVVVTVAGTTYSAITADSSGTWTLTLPAGSLPAGTQDVAVSVNATDPAGNTSSATGTIAIDTLVTPLTMTSNPGGVDGVINATESQNGVTLSGHVEPGSTLVVTMGAVSLPATVLADGSWSVDFPASAVPQGDLQSVAVTLNATDAAGNTASASASLQFDTSAGYLTIDPAPIEGDDVINAVEAADGVTINGTATPNTLVTVTLGGVQTTVLSTAAGTWSATYAASQIPPDTDMAAITASITDAAGNSLQATDSVAIDTVVENQNVGTMSVGVDNIVNALEAQAGVVVTGTTEPGATSVVITIEGQSIPATINSAAGTWSVTLPQGMFNANDEYSVDVVVQSTDAAGNVDQISTTIQVDTWVNTLELSPDSATADGVVSASELSTNGLALSGQVEAGSTLNVVFNGQTYAANVSNTGAWTLVIPAANVPGGEYTATITLNATDAAGNTATTSGSVQIDTVAPEGPQVEFVLEAPDGVAGIFVGAQTDAQAIYELADNGTVSAVSYGTPTDTATQTIYTFDNNVPDGSHLVITSQDTAGNTRGTVLVLEDGAAGGAVDMANANLGAMNIDTIQLEFAEDAALTLTEADILALSSATNTVMVTGGSDDQVNISGATSNGTVVDNGQSYAQYTLGEATILVDSDITNVVT